MISACFLVANRLTRGRRGEELFVWFWSQVEGTVGDPFED